MKYLKYTLYMVLLAVMGIACKVDSSKFPIDTDEVLNPDNQGGFLRVIPTETTGGTWNVLDLGSQKYALTIEADDAENGGQLESVDFYVGFQDNPVLPMMDQTNIDVQDSPIRTVPASDFTVNEDSGLPRATITFTSDEVFSALGIDASDVIIGSTVLLRWTENLTNGKSFNADNSGINIKSGEFYNSPFATNISQAVGVDQAKFVGSYKYTQDAKGAAGPVGAFGDGYVFGPSATGTVDIAVDPDNPLNGRVFTADGAYLDGAGFGTIPTIQFAFTINPLNNMNYTTVVGKAGTGVSCNSGISLGAPTDVSLQGSWDGADDSEFHLTIVDDVTADCGTAEPLTFTFTKQ